MALSVTRIGYVSSVDYDAGMAEVTYPDKDDLVTADLPVLSFTDEYKMPHPGDEVVVAHLSNGAEAGVILGRYWNLSNTPPASGEGVFHKELGSDYGDSFMHYEDGKLVIFASEIEIRGSSAVKVKAPAITLEGEVEATKSVGVAKNISVGANADVGYTLTAAADVLGGGKSLIGHTHTCPDGKTTPPD